MTLLGLSVVQGFPVVTIVGGPRIVNTLARYVNVKCFKAENDIVLPCGNKPNSVFLEACGLPMPITLFYQFHNGRFL